MGDALFDLRVGETYFNVSDGLGSVGGEQE